MYFKYKNIKIFYEKYGDDKNDTLIILPGWGDNRNTFNRIIKLLEKDYNIYIFDYPGFGNSNLLNEDLTIYEYAKIFIEFLKVKKIKNPIIIGHSFGGRIIITMSGYYNIKFKKIILMASAGIKPKKSLYIKIKQIIYKTLKKISFILPNSSKEKYLKKLINIFGSSDYKSIPKGLQKTFINIVNEDLKGYLTNIKDETLIMWGEKDIDTPICNAYTMNKLIKNSGLIIIKDALHFFYLEKPNYINTILLNYLKKEE